MRKQNKINSGGIKAACAQGETSQYGREKRREGRGRERQSECEW